MSYLEELLTEFRKGAKIRLKPWEDHFYIYLKDGVIYGEDNRPVNYSLNDVYEWFYSPQWELYKEPIDWDYIIKNKCLCWFWNGDDRNKGIIDYLVAISHESYDLYENTSGCRWSHCHPVQKDEVTFYEDKES